MQNTVSEKTTEVKVLKDMYKSTKTMIKVKNAEIS
jgi:hypothetical protein